MPTAYITAPPDAAEDLATLLVEQRHAACVNVLDCRSFYRWNDELQADEEVVLLAKTTDDTYPALVEAVLDHHPYDVPCVERIEDDPIEAFASWRAEATH